MACTCPDLTKNLGIHAVGCPEFVNLIPNEIVTVFLPTPDGNKVTVSDEDAATIAAAGAAKEAADAAAQAAAKTLQEVFNMCARKYGLDTKNHFWWFDLRTKTWTKTN